MMMVETLDGETTRHGLSPMTAEEFNKENVAETTATATTTTATTATETTATTTTATAASSTEPSTGNDEEAYEVPEGVDRPSLLSYDCSSIDCPGKVKEVTTATGTTMWLLDVVDVNTGQRPTIAVKVPMKLGYHDVKNKKIHLKLNLHETEALAKFAEIKKRMMELASARSEDAVGKHWSMEDMQRRRFSTTKDGQVKIKYGPKTTFWDIIDLENEVFEEDATTGPEVLERGSILLPIFMITYIYYTNTSCGFCLEGDVLASFRYSTINRFVQGNPPPQFLLDTATTKRNLTNRYFTDVILDKELEFSGKTKISTLNKNKSYYFYMDPFQLPPVRARFGFQFPKKNPDSKSGSIDVDVTHPELAAFLNQHHNLLCEGAFKKFTKWCDCEERPDYITPEYLKEEGIVPSLKRDPKPEHRDKGYAPKLSLKFYRTTPFFVYDEATDSYRQGSYEDVTKNCLIEPIVNFEKLHFVGSGLTTSGIKPNMKIEQAIIRPNANQQERSRMSGFRKRKKPAAGRTSSAGMRMPTGEATTSRKRACLDGSMHDTKGDATNDAINDAINDAYSQYCGNDEYFS